MAQKKSSTHPRRSTTDKSASSRGRATGTTTTTRTTRSRGGRKSASENGHTQGRHMLESLEEGFLSELADAMSGEHQLLKALPKMGSAVESRRLKQVFEQHLDETQEHIQRLEQVFREFRRAPETETCEGMQGILSEGQDLLKKVGPGPLRDALVIAAAQKAEHYEIATYGSLCAWALELGETRVLRLLEDTLSEEKMMDLTLTRIAESSSNADAPERMRGGREERGDRRGDRDGRGEREGRDDRSRRDWDERSFTDDRRNRGFQGMRGRPDWETPYSDSRPDDRSRSRMHRDKRSHE